MSDVGAFWDDIDVVLERLVSHGAAKLPSLEGFDLEAIAKKITEEMEGATFFELCASHKIFLDALKIDQVLAPKLFEIARKGMGYRGDISNQYHIARRIGPGDDAEAYRAHFDSHLFTLVLPIKIPISASGGAVGDLIYFPKARHLPKSEFDNFWGKLIHKKFASKVGIKKFSNAHEMVTDDFDDYRPLLFVGNTTLHANKQVSLDCAGDRLTLLAHFFDPNPKYGVGEILRKLRNR